MPDNPQTTKYALEGRTIIKKPVTKKNKDGSENISMGFPVCTVSEWVNEKEVLRLFERHA